MTWGVLSSWMLMLWVNINLCGVLLDILDKTHVCYVNGGVIRKFEWSWKEVWKMDNMIMSDRFDFLFSSTRNLVIFKNLYGVFHWLFTESIYNLWARKFHAIEFWVQVVNQYSNICLKGLNINLFFSWHHVSFLTIFYQFPWQKFKKINW